MTKKQVRDLIERVLEATKGMSTDGEKFDVLLRPFYNDVKTSESSLKEFSNYIEENSTNEDGFKIFFFLQFHLRYQRDFVDSKMLFDRFEVNFKKYLMYPQLYALYCGQKGFLNYQEAISVLTKTKLVAEQNEHNSGNSYIFPKMFCDIYDTFTQHRDELVNDYFKSSREAIDKAFDIMVLNDLKDISVYHVVKGRLLAIDKKYGDAISSVKHAISIENSARPDYAIVINDYYRIISNIQLQENREKLALITNGLEKKVSNLSKMDFSILAIFVSIATFAIGGVSISKSFINTPQAAAMLIATTFISLIVFISLAIIPVFKEKKVTMLASLIAVIASVALGLMIGLGF